MVHTVTEARIFAVIVLYGMSPADAKAYQSLQRALRNVPPGKLDFRILLYDNTPGGCDAGSLTDGVLYERAEQNAGLAGAYNRALSIAQIENYTWLLTLDQDSTLPSDYLSVMSDYALDMEPDNRVAAIVPELLDAGRLLSPVVVRFWGARYLRQSSVGIARQEMHAYNSASLFRVGALRQIGGFNPYFWLDHQDAYIFRQLHRHGKKVYAAGNMHVEHALSLLHGEKLNPDRFSNYLKAESAFCDLYGGWIEGLSLTGRLLVRIWRRRRGDDPEIRQLTWDALMRRLFQSKMRRIRDWKSEMEGRMRSLLVAGKRREPSEERPAISVCMAAYNGEQYITAQLQSILRQLAAEDEVVVVDDASTDGTRERVRSLQDGRIRLIEHDRNLGISRTFEDAIHGASGKIIFLSDQDDLWIPGKVAIILESFRSHPDANLIVTDGAVINSDGSPLAESFYVGKARFRPGFWANLLRNRFGGCTMAFRAELLGEISPFPHNYDVLHDVWIGVRNSLSGGRTLFIEKPLVVNRRHTTTATGRKPLTAVRRLQIRLNLLLALAEFWFRKIMLSW